MSGKDFWGPKLWETIHIFAITYTPAKSVEFKQFINNLTVLLPCDECRLHLKSNLKKIPVDDYLTNNHQLFLWTYLLHDLVNQQLNKQSPPFEQIKLHYIKKLGAECQACKVK